MDKLTDLTILR